MKKDTLTIACAVLCPERALESVRRLDPWEAAQLIMDRWEPGKFKHASQLARLVICKIAFHVPYTDPRQRERAIEWACAEAPRWWSYLDRERLEESQLLTLFRTYIDTGRI